MEEVLESLTPKNPKMDLNSSVESDIKFWDTPNKDTFITFKEKSIAHGKIIDPVDMESLNYKVKGLFEFQGWIVFLSLPPQKVYETLVRMFYENLCSLKLGKVESLVLDRHIVLDCATLNSIY